MNILKILTSFSKRFIVVFFFSIVITGCGSKIKKKIKNHTVKDSTQTMYSSEFGFRQNHGYTKLWIKDDHDSLKFYYLVAKDDPIPSEIKNISSIIRTPVKSVVCTSTTQVPWFDYLNASEVLKGFSDPEYLYSAIQRSRYKDGILKDMGNGSNLELEQVASLQPELVFKFSGIKENKEEMILEKSGIVFMQTREHIEQHPLGRAEWIRFVGLLLNRLGDSDSIFNQVSREYHRLVAQKLGHINQPTVLTGIPYGGVWYMPGGGSYAATLFMDAGFSYPWSNFKTRKNLPLSFEKVYQTGIYSDYWIGASNFKTSEELIRADKRFAAFKSVQNSMVWIYDKKSLQSGGNDYFESAGLRPDLVLHDLIRIRKGIDSDKLNFYRRLH